MPARAIMLQGTGSNVGKSLLVSGLARALTLRGLAVRPFKPQNMSNNAAVTEDGGEIGRAQALQARAAKVAPTTDMNPVLLKPQSETGSQIIVQGRIHGTAQARDLASIKPGLLPKVLESFERLRGEADIILVEGAGSASETNLRESDIANMGFARAAGVPVIVIGDIDRGGVIASLIGTKVAVAAEDAAMIKGFIVNRMRGDPTLFDEGMSEIARRTGWAPIGLVPHFEQALSLPAEDAFELHDLAEARRRRKEDTADLTIAVPLLPRIANFDDFDPLANEAAVDLIMVPKGSPLPAPCDLVILPGSKATIADLAALREEGWDIDLLAHRRRGGRVLGICGGFQMLGRAISDPNGIEGPPATVEGLGLLDVDTVLTGNKQLVRVDGASLCDDVPFHGYEMHVGETTGRDTDRPVMRFSDGRMDGATSPDGSIVGTYVHGLFADDEQRAAWIERLGGRSPRSHYEDEVEAVLDALAAHLEANMDLDRLLSLAE